MTYPRGLKRAESRCATDNDAQVTNVSPQVTSRALRHLSPHSRLVGTGVRSCLLRYIARVRPVLSSSCAPSRHAWGRHRLDRRRRPRLRRERRDGGDESSARSTRRGRRWKPHRSTSIWRMCPDESVVRCSHGAGRARHPDRAIARAAAAISGTAAARRRDDRHDAPAPACWRRSTSIASSGSRTRPAPTAARCSAARSRTSSDICCWPRRAHGPVGLMRAFWSQEEVRRGLALDWASRRPSSRRCVGAPRRASATSAGPGARNRERTIIATL